MTSVNCGLYLRVAKQRHRLELEFMSRATADGHLGEYLKVWSRCKVVPGDGQEEERRKPEPEDDDEPLPEPDGELPF